ncbi:MAG: hypothetical protein D6744_13570 [Planctomycetota bacterium]|nr:MAG: hypothetical protein D6744_13570 [Planctomycetota bacterium]
MIAVAGIGGCRAGDSRLTLESYADPYFPEHYAVRFDRCSYYRLSDGDAQVAAHAGYLDAAEPSLAVDQYLHLHMFWKPWPGKTPDNPTSIDATVRYAIVTDDGAAVYEGTAYVYPRKARFSDDLLLKVESARLKRVAVVGEAPALLGDTRLVGTLRAKPDQAETLDIARYIDKTAAMESRSSASTSFGSAEALEAGRP